MVMSYGLPSPSLVIYSFLFFAALHSLPPSLASRKLLDLFPNNGFGGVMFPPGGTILPQPTTPVNNVNYTSATTGGMHGQEVDLNGRPVQKGATIKDKDGRTAMDGETHDGYKNAVINGPDGKPTMQGTNTPDSETGTINGSDGKPRYEAHRYNNGTSSVTVYDENGNPVYTINAPTGYYFTPPATP